MGGGRGWGVRPPISFKMSPRVAAERWRPGGAAVNRSRAPDFDTLLESATSHRKFNRRHLERCRWRDQSRLIYVG